jgi:hypothetical protein
VLTNYNIKIEELTMCCESCGKTKQIHTIPENISTQDVLWIHTLRKLYRCKNNCKSDFLSFIEVKTLTRHDLT